MQSIADIRKEYQQHALLENDVDPDPVIQFGRWWEDALRSEIPEVNAMTLATATRAGVPAARIVLLKGFSEKGFVFFSNYQSHKGKELEENPAACLVFFWKELERQVRLTGTVEKIPAAESDAYFATRPEGSRIGAWASPQSEVIGSRAVIETQSAGYTQQFGKGEIPRPPHWGGYLVKPKMIEFWQGRTNRLHDRLLYSLLKDGQWKIERLAP